ncbi:MAG: GNAT family N-acetyltransferase [Gammaproteobacteria bacterium]|nr:GNAT family N-acetyltransferase [Gammaproteobacteria bacterium]
MQALVDAGEVPGLLAYKEGKPVGWCAVAPRTQMTSMNRSPLLRPLDDCPVWSISCFFVDKSYRGQGVATGLLEAAKTYVRGQGGQCLEAYPTVSDKDRLPPVSSFMGMPDLFERAGFQCVAQPSKARQIWRYELPPRC